MSALSLFKTITNKTNWLHRKSHNLVIRARYNYFLVGKNNEFAFTLDSNGKERFKIKNDSKASLMIVQGAKDLRVGKQHRQIYVMLWRKRSNFV